MSEQGPVIHGLESQGRALTARALAARAGETDNIHFLCGTQSLRQENQVHLLDYNEETGVLDKTVYHHDLGEIWHLSSAPFDKDLLCTCYGCIIDNKSHVDCAVWRLGEEGTEPAPLLLVEQLKHTSNVRSSMWHPSSLAQMVTVDDKKLTLWKFAGESVREHSSLVLDGKGRSSYSSLCWNPHHNCTQVLSTMDGSAKAWDIRTNKVSFTLDHLHGPCVRGLDFNPNKPHHFASCGDDCTVKFWDCRKLSSPLVTRQDHSHWIWSVQFNLFHDQLILTSSSDSQVVLTRMASIASESLQHIEDIDECAPQTPPKDEVIATYEEHEDSVYSAVWSVTDAWVFASLSYDGRLVINHVPSQEKFAILTS